MSCPEPQESTFPSDLTIKDLAPINFDDSANSGLLETINLDLHIIEVPAENFSKLDDIRRTLDVRSIRFNSYLAFSANFFSAYVGQSRSLSTVSDLLQIAGAQHVTRMAIMLPDEEADNVPIKELSQTQSVDFTSTRGLPETVRVGPGVIAMHIRVEKSKNLDNAGTVTIFPIFTLMSGNTIPELDYRAKLRDFSFTDAALQLDMRPSDFVFLAPERYISDQSTLSGVFFSNPNGTLFTNLGENKAPERKPSVRIYLLRCVGLNL